MTEPLAVKRSNPLLNVTTAVGVGLLAGGGFTLSFASLRALAVASGIPQELAFIWPLIVDGFIVVATAAAFVLGRNGRRVTWYPWAALILFSAISVAGNALHATEADLRVPLVVATIVSAVPAIALLIASHLLVVMVSAERRGKRIHAAKPAKAAARLDASPDLPAPKPVQEPGTRPHAARAANSSGARSLLESRVRDAMASGTHVTGSMAAEWAGVPLTTAKRWLNEIKRTMAAESAATPEHSNDWRTGVIEHINVSSDLEFIRPEFAFEREFGQFRNWWARDTRIVGNAMSVLMYLVSHKQTFRITQQKARSDLGLGRDAFRAARDKLEAAGFLEAIERRYPAGTIDRAGRPVGGHRYVVYRLLDPQEPAEIREIMREEASADNPPTPVQTATGSLDNSAIRVSTQASTENPSPGDPVPENPSLKEDQVKENQSSSSSSSSSLGLATASIEGDDDASAMPPDDDGDFPQFDVLPSTANLLREVHPRLDAGLLVRRLSARLRIETIDLERAAVGIITASARVVGDPVAYVASSIEKEPGRWVRADLLALDSMSAAPPARTDAQEVADVRSARARGLVPKDWPDSLPLDASARTALEAARGADRARLGLETNRKDTHV